MIFYCNNIREWLSHIHDVITCYCFDNKTTDEVCMVNKTILIIEQLGPRLGDQLSPRV